MKTINTKIIRDLKPCQDRLDNWLKHYSSFDSSIEEFLDLKEITHKDKLWVYLRLMPKEFLGPIAADFAEEVVYIYEKFNPDSSVLKKAIQAARDNYSGTDSAAYHAACDAARAADAAAYVAAAARATDAYDAACARAADVRAASNAAYAATYAASTTNAINVASVVYAASRTACAATFAISCAGSKMETKQIEILKKWLVKS